MVVKANMPRVARKWAPAFVAAFAVAFSAAALTAPAAQAAETKVEAPSVGAMDWRPTLTPFYPDRETVRRNLSGAQRGALLRNCPSGYVCVAAGEGDGQHTVYTLYYCPQRSLSNFINAGGVNNNQVGNAVTRLKTRNGSTDTRIPATGEVVGVNWYPIWYLDPC